MHLYENVNKTHTKRVTELTKLGSKAGRYGMKVEIKCVKNHRAPIGITPDACWHKLWPNNSACTRNVSKCPTKLTKLDTIVDPKPDDIAYKLEENVWKIPGRLLA